jgi:hypothetical protein
MAQLCKAKTYNRKFLTFKAGMEVRTETENFVLNSVLKIQEFHMSS